MMLVPSLSADFPFHALSWFLNLHGGSAPCVVPAYFLLHTFLRVQAECGLSDFISIPLLVSPFLISSSPNKSGG